MVRTNRSSDSLWEHKWQVLSTTARRAAVEQVRLAGSKEVVRHPVVEATVFPDNTLQELINAGFVQRQPPPRPKLPDRVIVCKDAYDFLQRIHTLARTHLLQQSSEANLEDYVRNRFRWMTVMERLNRIVVNEKLPLIYRQEEILRLFVPRGEWPDWVIRKLHLPLARRVVDAIENHGGVIPRSALPTMLPRQQPAEVLVVVGDLLEHLALVEALDAETGELLVGLLPSVLTQRQQARQEETRPSLVACASPADLFPPEGYLLDDLRAFLLELAAGPARCRQQGGLFQKETDRFRACLAPLPAGFLPHQRDSVEYRLSVVESLSNHLKLVRSATHDGGRWLELTQPGKTWLGSSFAQQYRIVYNWFYSTPASNTHEAYSFGYSDGRFLAAEVIAYKVTPCVHEEYWHRIDDEERATLRRAFSDACQVLPRDTFVTLASFLDHVCTRNDHPLMLGLEMEQVRIQYHSRMIPPMKLERLAVARQAMEELLWERLVPLGCFILGNDPAHGLCVARHRRLDAYFGKPVPDEELVGGNSGTGRVLVQPDFTIIIIGSQTGASAELAPFCERQGGRGAGGTLQLKLTRSAVLRAAQQGLTGAEMLARLQRHSSAAVPANVLREVREWADWVRPVDYTPAMIFRCPDRATADRLVAALGRDADRLTETVVILPTTVMLPPLRKKLQDQGLLPRTQHPAAPDNQRRRKR